jgi:hypothetical protein
VGHMPPEKPRSVDILRVKQCAPTKAYNLIDVSDKTNPKPLALNMGAGMIAQVDVPSGWSKSLDPRYGCVTGCSPYGSHAVLTVDGVGLYGKERVLLPPK